MWPAASSALVVGTQSGFLPATNINPALYESECAGWTGDNCTGGWTEWTLGGDPGWDHHTASGQDYVYLGDSWVLQALHTGTPTSANFVTGNFTPIPGQLFTVPNPLGMGLSANTDLRLFRINGDPGLPSLTIASQRPPVGGEVAVISLGRRRAINSTTWKVDESDNDSWVWNSGCDLSLSTCNEYTGFSPTGSREKRFGTNQIVHANSVLEGHQPNVTGVINLGSETNPRHIISLFSKYDESGGTPFESQAVGGDSGGSVFYKRDGEWELVGILNAVLIHNNQSTARAIFGNATSFADLSTYRDAILAIMENNAAYSILGDLNLDGQLTGDGAGPPETDDIAAFIQGWGYNNGSGIGDITSWMHGDLNRDGQVDVTDFLLMRQAMNGTIPTGAFAALLPGVSFVPEPSSAVLLFLGAWWMGLCCRRRRQR